MVQLHHNENWLGSWAGSRLCLVSVFLPMKVTLNWLKQYVDFNWSVAKTVERSPSLDLALHAASR